MSEKELLSKQKSSIFVMDPNLTAKKWSKKKQTSSVRELLRRYAAADERNASEERESL
jgi:hypothetical protein